MAEALPGSALPQERQQWILARLRSQGRVLAAALADELKVSEDSIRRDLRELAAQGLCKRVYGGALPLAEPLLPLAQRRRQGQGAKRALALRAVQLLQRDQVVLIDAGSTNAALAAALPADYGLTVITNAPDIAQLLIEREGFRVELIGGRIEPRSGAAIGARAIDTLRALRADLCFPGACAVDPDSGVWSPDSEEAHFKRAMVEASGETVILATSDKLGAAANYRVARLAEVQHLVLQHDAPAALREAFASQGCEPLLAAPQ